ncbi:acyl-CoA desaturase [Undibacterium sp. TS12]|uniref:acyl-CoA desaturase n=1 Tax=Undibacterium sp. TS12 TaxID=2908202 RepID=UPI001F4C5BF2|nr:acyl-CoA desaturase [Undibacterium sp. TS12]MCH8619884.1 acyl-CoA desaturase [Undibacterium sp. TS12]
MKESTCHIPHHRINAKDVLSVQAGEIRYAPAKSLWFIGMSAAAVIGGLLNYSHGAFVLFLLSTATVLLFGHSLGSHRKLIHDSFACPVWLEYLLVYLGVQVGLAGPIGLLRQHELRDYAQRMPDCHDYLRHGSSFWVDAWWQLNCELHLQDPPQIHIEARIADDRFYQFLEKTWMLQHALVAPIFYSLGGWGYVFWGVCARISVAVFGHWLIGYFAHGQEEIQGQMHYEVRGAAVQGRNVAWVSLLTMGECWHNNHHAYPGSARLGLQDGEWDPGWWVLMLLQKMGLVSNVKLPDDLPFRPELYRYTGQSLTVVRQDKPLTVTVPKMPLQACERVV